jgi:3alpha(or 20beta)-hydroxysteroid dehydrogenase
MNESTGRVEGKVAIVTGGSRGMGAAHVRTLVAEGARVVIADVLDEPGAALAAELPEATRYMHLDVTDEAEWDRVVASAVEEFGTVDILVNNAGISKTFPLIDFPMDAWNAVIAVNLTGSFLGMRAVAPVMTAAGRGSIINVSSIEGIQAVAEHHAYVASKFAIRGITKSAAIELGASGIRVNSIHPGLIETPMTEGMDASIMQIALQRAAQPSEVSNLVLFLASEDSSYSTGSEFVIDGGVGAKIALRD